jgi:ribosomal protein L29
MKKKDFTEIRGKSIQELAGLVGKKRLLAAKKKMEIVVGKEKNLRSFKNLRLEIAKILTLIREKEILEKMQPKKTEEVKTEKGKENV